MVDKEMLEAISQMMDAKLKPIQDDIATLKEGQEEMRDSLNTLIGWADDVACVVKVPLKPAQ